MYSIWQFWSSSRVFVTASDVESQHYELFVIVFDIEKKLNSSIFSINYLKVVFFPINSIK